MGPTGATGSEKGHPCAPALGCLSGSLSQLGGRTGLTKPPGVWDPVVGAQNAGAQEA